MYDDKIVRDVDYYIGYLSEIKAFLDKMYYNPDFSTVFTRPMVSFLDHACDFLIDNLTKLKERYIEKTEGS